MTVPSTGGAAHLRALRDAFAEHVEASEGPHGRYAELIEHAPRLAAGVAVLVREHEEVLRSFDRLLRGAPIMDEAELKVRAGTVLRDLSRHRQRGADLVHEAYSTDIGGET